MSRIQVQMNFSRHFDKTGVREIGRKSLKMITINAHAQHLYVKEVVGVIDYIGGSWCDRV